MAAANHIIQRQVLEVEMEDTADAFQFRNRLGEVFYEKVLPGMEALFNELGAGKTIRLDKLELDLGMIDKANWEQQLREKAVRKLSETLMAQSPVLIGSEELEKQTGSSVDFSKLFIYFLSTGRLPWHAKATINFEKDLKEQLSPGLISALHEFLKTAHREAVTRLVYQLDNELLLKLMNRLSPNNQHGFTKNFKQAADYISGAFNSSGVSPVYSRAALFMPFFSWFSSNQYKKLDEFYAAEFAELIQTRYPGNSKSFYLAAVPASYKSNKILQQIEKELTSVSIKRQLVDEPLHPKKKVPDADAEIYIENAGLVMLHPFLSTLFTQLNLLEKGKFMDELAQMKAVLLCQYLVDGSTETEEHQLVLNKLLCGMPLETPVMKTLDLSGSEKAEADDLLSQVIKLWIKNNTPVNSTIEGLQQSFLQRTGKLQQQDKNWRLQVEQKAFDMLLSSLPWGISIIRNSWMQEMIWVDWG